MKSFILLGRVLCYEQKEFNGQLLLPTTPISTNVIKRGIHIFFISQKLQN